MRLRWRELFTSNIGATARWDRFDFVTLAISLLIGLWVFVLKIRTFYHLGYSEDLFVSLQAARSWLEGKGMLRDNCWGNILTIHTYFLLLPLGFVAKPFGAPGLLFILGASVGATYFWAARVLRLLGVTGTLAALLAAVVLVSPISVGFYQEWYFGFHVEDLAPALCLMLFYFLLQKRLIPSVLTALVVVSLKEDAPIATAMVAIVASVEAWMASSDKTARSRINWPAAIVFLLSLLAIPVLLAISFSQPSTAYAPHSIDRIAIVKPGRLFGLEALFVFVVSNIGAWLGSDVVRQWLWVMMIGSLGTILFRPFYLIVGLPATLVAWLKYQNDLLWAPRFYSTAALLWCVTLLGFASIMRAIAFERRMGPTAALATVLGIIAFCAFAQLDLLPTARNAYVLRCASPYSPQERRQADEVFSHYRRAAKPAEPVAASTWLFRYAHDRNLFWLDKLNGRPAPIWMLGDSEDEFAPLRISSDKIDPKSGIHLEDYTVIDRRGRFVLLRKKQ